MERWYEFDGQKTFRLPESTVKDDKSKKGEGTKPEIFEEPKEPVSLAGSITIGGHNLEDVELKWWRSQIGLVQQEPSIFNDTIRANVEFGLIGSKWENEDADTKKTLVEEACKEAFADEFIVRLPMVCLSLRYRKPHTDQSPRAMKHKLEMLALSYLGVRDNA